MAVAAMTAFWLGKLAFVAALWLLQYTRFSISLEACLMKRENIQHLARSGPGF